MQANPFGTKEANSGDSFRSPIGNQAAQHKKSSLFLPIFTEKVPTVMGLSTSRFTGGYSLFLIWALLPKLNFKKGVKSFLNNVNITVSSPHQKVIMTKKTLSDADHLYSRTNIEAMLTAASSLSDKTFKLYARMNLHQDDYVYALSPTAIKKEIGMSEEKYRNAVKELKAKGYLQLVPGRKNLYAFYEYPQKDSAGTGCWGVNEESADQVTTPVDHGEDLMGHISNSEESSTENDGNSPPMLPDNPAEQNTEILQDITGNITEDNELDIPVDITGDDIRDALQSISYSSEPSWQEQVEARKRAQEFERQMREYTELISGVDPDDLYYYDHLNPVLNRSFGRLDTAIDWDDPGLPF